MTYNVFGGTAPLNRLCPCYGAIEIVEVIIIITKPYSTTTFNKG